MRKISKNIIKLSLTILIFLSLIFWYSYISNNKIYDAVLFPPIENIVKSFKEDLEITKLNLISSIKLLIPSIIITLVISLTFGSILGLNKKLRDALYPVIYAFSCVPSILLSTFILVLSPSFWWGSVILIIYDCLFATLFATITGIQSIDKRYIENANTLKLSKIKKFFKIILPAASPSIFAGFTNSLRSAFVILVFAEMYSGSTNGLGFYVKKYNDIGQYSKMWSGFIFMVLVLIIVMLLFEQIKKYILRWTIS